MINPEDLVGDELKAALTPYLRAHRLLVFLFLVLVLSPDSQEYLSRLAASMSIGAASVLLKDAFLACPIGLFIAYAAVCFLAIPLAASWALRIMIRKVWIKFSGPSIDELQRISSESASRQQSRPPGEIKLLLRQRSVGVAAIRAIQVAAEIALAAAALGVWYAWHHAENLISVLGIVGAVLLLCALLSNRTLVIYFRDIAIPSARLQHTQTRAVG